MKIFSMRISTSQRADRPLFSFLVVADTHVNESDDASTSPFVTNQLANERARYVFQEISRMEEKPAFVVHLGDIVHPVPGLPTYGDAVGLFKDMSASLDVPLHVIPGNHDVGDKRINWMPADQVCDDYLDTYREAFGEDFYAFDHGPVRFVMLNSLLINSGLDDETRQREWFEQEVSARADKRLYVFMHYPPYIYSTDERGNYDNIDEPGRSWLIEQLGKPGVEAIFAGHVHNYWYDTIGSADFYMMPSTAFLRHDFSEFYSVAPAVEFARGDVERFGYFQVDVFEDTHIAYSVRTMGGRCAINATIDTDRNLRLAHPKSSSFDRVGVELRHPWSESMQIASTGGVQEFGRKWARNDYPLLALTEMGARLAKVPDIDLLETESRERMHLLSGAQHQFLVTTLGAPRPDILQHDLPAAGVCGFEVNATYDDFVRDVERYRDARKRANVPFYLAKILSGDDSRFDGKHFTHFVKAGFLPSELDRYRDRIADAITTGAVDGITVRHEADDPLVQTWTTVCALAADLGCRVLISIKLAGPQVSSERAEDRLTAVSAAQALVLSAIDPAVSIVFDTFMDVDRGYYPRHAFIDRRFNPRAPAIAFTQLNSILSGLGAVSLETAPESDAIQFRAGDTTWALYSGPAGDVAAAIDSIGSRGREIEIIDLISTDTVRAGDISRAADTQCILCKIQ